MVTQNPFVQYGKEIWWMILIRGIFGVIFGIIALVWPGITVVALVFLFGIYSIADGLITIVRAVRDREHLSSWGWWVFTGVVSVGAGIVALVWPGITALVLLYIIAFYAIMFGIFGIVGAFKMKALPGSSWGWLLAASVLAVIFGIILLIAPGEGIISLIWLLGWYAILFGLFMIVGAFQIRSRAKEAGVL
ncbi:HdeD family acid-resistance protein [Rhodococcus qingshengii]|uniref:HdeD family acid-resistance protein n=1 Tax=Rhodococcus qingshengii TaxID=334542 RepID=UPI001ADF2843|nr:HdeD family acid-resistance protein [Rhodococcus qingshengii]MCQ4148747.1 HdeD family acid-resistance protein [Rhodococcus qingshengii]